MERNERQRDHINGGRFMEPRDKRPLIGGDADFKHKKLLE